MFVATKLRRGMILIRIRGGGQTLNLWGKAMCQLLNPFDLLTFPCLIQLPPLKVMLLVGEVMAGEWSVAGLSVLAHTHTPPTG